MLLERWWKQVFLALSTGPKPGMETTAFSCAICYHKLLFFVIGIKWVVVMGTKNKTARNIKSLSIVSPVLIRFYDSTPLCKSQQQITTAGDGTVINKDLTINLTLLTI